MKTLNYVLSILLRRGISVFAFLIIQVWQLNAQNCSALPNFNVTLNNQTINVPTVYPINSWIRITGTVNFNANVTMSRCTVLMDPGAILNINNSTFTMTADASGNRSLIFGCGAMWQAIRVNTGAAVVFRNSDIKNGIQGLVFAQGFLPNLTEIKNCSFSANSVAITAQNVNNFSFFSFSGNTFTGTSPFNPMIPPFVAGSPLNAFLLNSVTGTIGTSGSQNLIRNMSTGIRATNSNLTVNNCTFAGITLANPQNVTTPAGIDLRNSSLTIQNIFSNNASCSFTSCGIGINSIGTQNFVVKNAVFTNQTRLDIMVGNSNNAAYNVNISNNKITVNNPRIGSISVDRASIGFNSSPAANNVHTRIQSNIINLPAGGNPLISNIRFMNFTAQAGALDDAIIADNQITCAYGNGPIGAIARTIDGIWIFGAADGWQVSGNIINYANPVAGPPNEIVNSVGISMQLVTGTRNIIGPNNNTTSILFPLSSQRDSWLRCGIHIDGSPTVAVCKNDANNIRHDYHFMNNCPAIEFGRNIIRNAHFGLEIWGPVPNNHDYRMNEWLPSSPYTSKSAEITAPPLIVNGGQSAWNWRVDGSNGNVLGYMPPTVGGKVSPSGWISNIQNNFVSFTFICDAVIPPAGFGEMPTGEIATKFVNGEYGNLSSTDLWDFERVLLTAMIRNSAAFSGNIIAQAYYDNKVNSNVWELANAERMMHEAFFVSEQNQQSLDQWNKENRIRIDSIGMIEQWEGMDTTTTDSIRQIYKKALQEQCAITSNQIDSLSLTIRNQHLSNLISVNTYVQSIKPNNAFETNYKTILLLKAKLYNDDNWTITDSIALRDIAYSCLQTGGEAVSIARELLPDPESFGFDREGEDPYCSRPRSIANENLLDKSIAIWPNPTSQTLMVGFDVSFSGRLEIVNMTGNCIRSINLRDSKQEALSISDLPNGVYFLYATRAGQPPLVKKITVLH